MHCSSCRTPCSIACVVFRGGARRDAAGQSARPSPPAAETVRDQCESERLPIIIIIIIILLWLGRLFPGNFYFPTVIFTVGIYRGDDDDDDLYAAAAADQRPSVAILPDRKLSSVYYYNRHSSPPPPPPLSPPPPMTIIAAAVMIVRTVLWYYRIPPPPWSLQPRYIRAFGQSLGRFHLLLQSAKRIYAHNNIYIR